MTALVSLGLVYRLSRTKVRQKNKFDKRASRCCRARPLAWPANDSTASRSAVRTGRARRYTVACERNIFSIVRRRPAETRD